MSRLGVATWKEWRDHRAVLLWTLGAIPVLTVAVLWAFHRRLTTDDLRLFPPIALAVGCLALGLDGFARDVPGGHLSLLLRTPGATRSAFVAKSLLSIAAGAAAYAVEILVLAAIDATGALTVRTTTWTTIVSTLDDLPVHRCVLAWVVAATPWLWLGSIATGRAGAAALAGPALLALLAVPLLHLQSEHPWYFVLTQRDVALLAAVGAASGWILAGIAWFRGRHTLSPRRRPLAVAVLALLAICATGYGVASAAATRWLDVDPARDDFRIVAGTLGTGGRRLFLDACRGRPWSHGFRADPPDGARHEAGTPTLPIVVDLLDGSWRAAGPFDSTWSSAESSTVVTAFAPAPWVLLHDPRRVGAEWFDGRTAAPGSRSSAILDPEQQSRLRERIRDLASVPDASGRRAFVWADRLVRDGDPVETPTAPIPRESLGTAARAVAGGFLAFGGRFDDPEVERFLDLRTGRWREVRIPSGSIWLGPDRSMIDVEVESAAGAVPRAPRAGWRLTETVDGTAAEPPSPTTTPTRIVGVDLADWDVRAVVAVDTLLLLREATGDAPTRAMTWNPSTDERRPVAGLEGRVAGGDHVWVTGPRVDGTFAVLVNVLPAPSGATRRGRAVGRFDPATATIRWATSRLDLEGLWPIAFDDDGSLLAIEDGRRVVRHGPAEGARKVEFPRGR